MGIRISKRGSCNLKKREEKVDKLQNIDLQRTYSIINLSDSKIYDDETYVSSPLPRPSIKTKDKRDDAKINQPNKKVKFPPLVNVKDDSDTDRRKPETENLQTSSEKIVKYKPDEQVLVSNSTEEQIEVKNKGEQTEVLNNLENEKYSPDESNEKLAFDIQMASINLSNNLKNIEQQLAQIGKEYIQIQSSSSNKSDLTEITSSNLEEQVEVSVDNSSKIEDLNCKSDNATNEADDKPNNKKRRTKTISGNSAELDSQSILSIYFDAEDDNYNKDAEGNISSYKNGASEEQEEVKIVEEKTSSEYPEENINFVIVDETEEMEGIESSESVDKEAQVEIKEKVKNVAIYKTMESLISIDDDDVVVQATNYEIAESKDYATGESSKCIDHHGVIPPAKHYEIEKNKENDQDKGKRSKNSDEMKLALAKTHEAAESEEDDFETKENYIINEEVLVPPTNYGTAENNKNSESRESWKGSEEEVLTSDESYEEEIYKTEERSEISKHKTQVVTILAGSKLVQEEEKSRDLENKDNYKSGESWKSSDEEVSPSDKNYEKTIFKTKERSKDSELEMPISTIVAGNELFQEEEYSQDLETISSSSLESSESITESSSIKTESDFEEETFLEVNTELETEKVLEAKEGAADNNIVMEVSKQDLKLNKNIEVKNVNESIDERSSSFTLHERSDDINSNAIVLNNSVEKDVQLIQTSIDVKNMEEIEFTPNNNIDITLEMVISQINAVIEEIYYVKTRIDNFTSEMEEEHLSETYRTLIKLMRDVNGIKYSQFDERIISIQHTALNDIHNCLKKLKTIQVASTEN